MAARSRRPLAPAWAAYLPAVFGPVGGGAIKLGGGSTTAAVAVALAPYAVYGLALAPFLLTFVAALVRCMMAGPGGEEAMERLVNLSAAAVVSVLTLSAPPAPSRPECPASRAGNDGRKTTLPAIPPDACAMSPGEGELIRPGAGAGTRSGVPPRPTNDPGDAEV